MINKIAKNSLKTKAFNAKKRIASGKWAMVNDEEVSDYDKHYLISKKYAFNHIGRLNLPYANFDSFFDTVYDIIQKDHDNDNPIKMLVNLKYLNELSQENQQRYVFNLSRKFIFIKTVCSDVRERIYLEKLKQR